MARNQKTLSIEVQSEHRKRVIAEERLDEAAKLYQAVFNQTFQLIAVLDAKGVIVDANDTLRNILLPAGEVIFGKPVWEISGLKPDAEAILRNAVADAAHGDFFRDEMTGTSSAGTKMVFDFSLKPIRSRDGGIERLIFEARDITRRKQDHDARVKSQKMEMLGQFASGIAHDFNNVLMVISGNIEMALKASETSGGVRKRLEKAFSAVQSGQQLTSRILGYARRPDMSLQTIDVGAVLEDAIGLAQTGLDSNVSVELRKSADLPYCWSEPALLQTAILNLLINAKDAMAGEGMISIEASCCEPSSEGAPSDFVRVSVTDTGTGISPDVQGRIFEPFFTTKGGGEGSGLGLSLVEDFIEKSGGQIRIESDEGKGTTVHLLLQRSYAPEPVAGDEEAGDVCDVKGYRALVVDDDDALRDAAAALLADLGFEVDTAGDGATALDKIRRGDTPDLLFTDIVMPGGMDGVDLAVQAKREVPGIRVLLTSAHSYRLHKIERGGKTGVTRGNGVEILEKPYLYGELARKLRKLMAEDVA